MSDIQYIPVDFNEHIVPLGKINRIGRTEENDKQYQAYIDTDDAELFTALTPEDCCRRMWNAVKMFQNGY